MREVFRLRSREAIKAIRFSPSGRWLVVLPQSGGSIQLYERTGAIYAPRGSIAGFGIRRSSILNAEFHPDGLLTVAGENRRLETWDLTKQHLVHEFGSLAPSDSGRLLVYEGLALSPDGRYVETSFLGRNRGERYLWATGELLAHRWGNSGPFVFHPEGTLIAVAAVDSEYYTQVQLCSWTGRSYIWYPPVLVAHVAVGGASFSRDGRSFAMIGGVDSIWCQVHSLPHCAVSFRLNLGAVDELRFPNEISEAIYVFDTHLVTGRADGTIIGVDIHDGHVIFEELAHPDRVMSVQLHPTLPLMATASNSGDIIMWEIDRTEVKPSPPHGGVTREFIERFPPFPEGQWRDPDNELTFEPPD
jgi:WD40 repeat protein